MPITKNKLKNTFKGDYEAPPQDPFDINGPAVQYLISGIKEDIDRSIKERQELDKKDIERQKRIEVLKAKIAKQKEEKESLDKGIDEPLLEAFDKKSERSRSRSPSPEPERKPSPRSKKDLNKYKLSKTAEIKVPDKVIDINNGRIKLVDTLDNKGDINKVDGDKVIDVVSYIPDSVKDSKIKVKQGSNSDISKEIKKLEGKIKRSKKPATIEKLNTELNNLLEKIEVI